MKYARRAMSSWLMGGKNPALGFEAAPVALGVFGADLGGVVLRGATMGAGEAPLPESTFAFGLGAGFTGRFGLAAGAGSAAGTAALGIGFVFLAMEFQCVVENFAQGCFASIEG
jgi:hypothetical protein